MTYATTKAKTTAATTPATKEECLLEHGHDIRTVQELLGHADMSTTMVYTHVMNKGARGVKSPLDRLEEARAIQA